MNSPKCLAVAPLTKSLGSLSGAGRGRLLLARLIEWTANQSPRGTLLLDFRGVATATASFLRESVLAFRDYARTYQPELFPVVANLNDELREEFDELLRQRREAMLACSADKRGKVVADQVLGVLEPGLAATLEVIRTRGAVSPGELREGKVKLEASTVSNRLASLARQGFVTSRAEGNRRIYSFVLDEGGGQDGD
jgi:DNA-binding transcriptional ArsR family regulator